MERVSMKPIAKSIGPSTLLCGVLCIAAPVSAQDVGIEGPSFAGAGATPTESKPESKVWYHDGFWWASLWSVADDAFNIHRLSTDGQTWTDTGVEIDSRPNSHSDALADGDLLYIGTHEFTTVVGSPGNPIQVQRYSYDSGSNTYSPTNGPSVVGDVSTETMCIEKDSNGTLWAVWMQDLRVWMSHTTTDDTTWSAETILPANGTDVRDDDICAIIHFDGDKIGVLWSDQEEDADFFAVHDDGAPDTSWSLETAIQGTGQADDHLNLAASSDGRVFASVKNAANETLLLERSAGGIWDNSLISETADDWTRPIVLLNEEDRTVHVFAMTARRIVEKSTSMDNINFPNGVGTTVINDASNVMINNPTSTKQNFDSTTGLLVLAGHETTERYWYHFVEGSSDPGPGPVGTILCAGDGSAGAACPCGNASTPGAGEGCLTSTGQGIRIDVVSASTAPDELALMATNVPPDNMGLFYVGDTMIGPNAVFDGLQCAGGFTIRMDGMQATSVGTATDTNFPDQDVVGPQFFVPGRTVYFQYYSRDNMDGPSPCGNMANLSSVLAVELAL